MDKKEVAKILSAIQTMYQNKLRTDNPEMLLDIWTEALREQDFETVFSNLKEYYKHNHFPPTVADLTKVEKRDRAIPTHEETQKLIASWEQEKANKADDETAQKHLAEMRKILNINRG